MSAPQSPRNLARGRLVLLVAVVAAMLGYGLWVLPRLGAQPVVSPSGTASPEPAVPSPALPKSLESNLPAEVLGSLQGDLRYLPDSTEGKTRVEFRLRNPSAWTVTSLLVSLRVQGGTPRSVLFMPGSPAAPGATVNLSGETDVAEEQLEGWEIVAAAGFGPEFTDLGPTSGSPVASPDPLPTSRPPVAGKQAQGVVAEFVQSSASGVLKLETAGGKNLTFTVNPAELSLPEGAPSVGDRVTVIYKSGAGGLDQALEIRSAGAVSSAPERTLPVRAFADPIEMMAGYYFMLDQDRYRDAYGLRSPALQQEQSYDEFLKQWDYNKSVKLEDVSLLAQTGRVALAEVWFVAQDGDGDRHYHGRVRLLQDGGGWLYDRGDFVRGED